MQVILLEKIANLGDLGQVVQVRAGFGRNYLVPQGKALPATKANQAQFDAKRAAFEQRQKQILQDAQDLAAKITGVQVVLGRPAGSSDKLFGSVTNADISTFFNEHEITLPKGAIEILQPIRTLGSHTIRIRLHPDIMPEVSVLVERQGKK
ncbi:MAG: 50S ribosomal protein L9 [Magnetococcus sp. DMHC-6]